MSETIKIREAEVADAQACSETLCASIRELCIADHHGDEDLIARWLENKTPENLQNWIQSTEATIYVAELGGEIAGVGGLSGSEVALNYVAPKHRGHGISRAMLNALEKILLDGDVRDAQLTSTATAHEFYRKAGWKDLGEPIESMGILGFPMSKTL